MDKLRPREIRLILLGVLIFASGLSLFFLMPNLPDEELWKYIFPLLVIISSIFPMDSALTPPSIRFVEKQNAMLDKGLPFSKIRLFSQQYTYDLFSSQGFKDNQRGYLRKNINAIAWYVRWLNDSSSDLTQLIKQEYHDVTCVYDTGVPEKRLLLFIQRDEITSDDIEKLNSFCTTLLQDEMNRIHANLPGFTHQHRPIAKISSYDCTILPVLMDARGNGQYLNASCLPRVSPRLYYPYADCCCRLEAFLSHSDI